MMNVKCHTNKSEEGGISLEAAVVMSILSTLMIFFVSLFQFLSGRSILEMSVLRTADDMARWAPVYRNKIITDITDNMLSLVDSDISEAMSDIPLISEIFNMRRLADYTDDSIYGIAAQSLCGYYIKNDALVKAGIVDIEDLNLYRSTFFSGDSDIISIKGECNINTYLPFAIKISCSADCAAWGRGRRPYSVYGGEDRDTGENTESVWDKDNFTRGKILRQMFGANLPDSFPLIAAYNGGEAVMIKSLNHVSGSYMDVSLFDRTIRNMIDKLYSFSGAEHGGIQISGEQIKTRRLVLVMPENEMTPSQDAALKSLMIYSASKFIMLDLQRYQRV